MKQLISILVTVFLVTAVMAQAPQRMSYQAVLRNSGGMLLPNNTTVGMRITICQGSATGPTVYMENQTTTTNQNGLINIEIGGGTVMQGSFGAIDWANGPFFLKTETDPAGGTNYTINGTSQLLSVPYALHAGNGGFSHYEVFNASGSFTIPAGVTNIMVEIWGGGGGGSTSTTNGDGGRGGGGGGYGKQLFSVVPGTVYPVTVGAGGLGVANSSGNNGGTSSFGTQMSATGGNGGPMSVSSGGGFGGGSTGVGPSVFQINGGQGANGSNALGSGGDAGAGGSGAPGGGGNGEAPGGGGAGTGVMGGPGGHGAAGRVVVWW